MGLKFRLLYYLHFSLLSSHLAQDHKPKNFPASLQKSTQSFKQLLNVDGLMIP